MAEKTSNEMNLSLAPRNLPWNELENFYIESSFGKEFFCGVSRTRKAALVQSGLEPFDLSKSELQTDPTRPHYGPEVFAWT